MAGHNKWSKVKRLKGALDQKRGKLFANLASSGAVSYLFQKNGTLTVPAVAIHEERKLELALEAPVTIVTAHDESAAAQVVRLIDALEENDDVQNMHTHFDAPEEAPARISG